MDPQYQQHPMAGTMRHNDDDAMTGMDDNMSTTPTGANNAGYPAQQEHYQASNGTFSPQQPIPSNVDSDPNARYPSSNPGYQQQQMQPQPYSRPSSGLSGQGDRHGYSQGQSQHQDLGRPQSSVVLKVGMVGDAQIGKTSLMVKYVEGSWDEDYIQTLGMLRLLTLSLTALRLTHGNRRQLHGEDDLDPQHRNNLLNLGSRRSA